MARGIQLPPTITRHVTSAVDGVRLRVVVTAAVDVSPKIFAYLRLPPQPEEGDEPRDVFDHICSPVDLEEYPEDEPAADAVPPWFRSDTIDMVFRSRTLIADYYSGIKKQAHNLCRSLDLMDTLEALEPPIWVGTPPSQGG